MLFGREEGSVCPAWESEPVATLDQVKFSCWLSREPLTGKLKAVKLLVGRAVSGGERAGRPRLGNWG